MNIAIHTVFILKENILFLEEWIYYHILLGFNKFYLYDNSKINKLSGFDSNASYSNTMIGGKINKYGINYDKTVNMTEKQMSDYVDKLCNKYKCIKIIDWSPTDNDGNILYNQVEAHNNCLLKLKKDNIDWCANIDMDEYIILKDFDNISEYISTLPEEIKNIKLGQLRFSTRFDNVNKLVTDITVADKNDCPRGHSNKNIYNVKNTIKIINPHSVNIEGIEYKPSITEILFNHYKLPKKFLINNKHVDNINDNINPLRI